MKVQTKHGEINIHINHSINETFFVLNAIDEQKNHLGKLSFSIEKHLDRCWLHNIETHDECWNRGVGTALVTAMEYIALKYFNITNIVGIFCPMIKDIMPPDEYKIKEDYVEKFYLSKGFKIDKYSTLYKSLDDKLKEYEQKIDMSYADKIKCKIDFDTVEDIYGLQK